MKKWISFLCALLLVCFTAAAFAEPYVSNLYRPIVPETLKTLLGGKSFYARVNGMEFTGQDEDTQFRISITVCERDRFDAAVIENLAVHDILQFGNGDAAMVMEVIPNEFGVTVKGGGEAVYSFNKTEDGSYTVATDTDYPFWTEIFTVTIPLEDDIRFLDWSDPENLGEPVERGFDALLDLLLEDTNFSPYNTQVTFDENGKLVELLYNYAPWN
ncbi:MAG: hypothetical protein IJ174_04530 [Clostridia bacterium]|nr:hypothetical protein [Clostridia bacterium]